MLFESGEERCCFVMGEIMKGDGALHGGETVYLFLRFQSDDDDGDDD